MESILEYQIAQRLAELGGRIYPQALPLKQWQMQSRCTRDEVVPQPPDSEWHQVDLPAQWGGSEMTTWFRRQITVPKEFAGKVVVLNIHPGGLDTEGLVSINGAPYQGLNTGRNEVLLTRNAEAGQRFEVLIEASAGVKKGPWTFSQCDLAVLQSQVEAFWYDAKVAFEAALVMPEGSSERERLLRAVYRSLMKVEPLYGDEGKFLNSISQASEVLRATVYATPKAETGPREPSNRPFSSGHSLGLAQKRDGTQTGPNLHQYPALHGTVPGVRFHLPTGPALPVCQRALPRALSAGQRAHCRRPLADLGWYVDRARL